MAVREDMAVALVKALDYTKPIGSIPDLYKIFSDASEISDELKIYVLIAYEQGLIKGYEDGILRPQGQLTRAEVATLINRVLDAQEEKPSTLPEFVYNSQNQTIDLGVNWNSYQYSYSNTTNPKSWYSPTKRLLDVSNIEAKYVFIRYKSNNDNYAIVNISGKTTMYTISYDANGGSGEPSNQTKVQGETLTISNIKPTRTGYKFLGWSLYKTSTTATYEPGDKYNNDATVTLYAIWQKAVTYRVTYNATWGTGAPMVQNKVQGETLILSTVEPTREGYVFKGWSTGISSTVVVYEPGDRYTNDMSITLYAVWEQETATPGQTTYTITYNANGGSGAPTSQTKIHDEDLVLRTNKPTKSGYTFLGWNTDKTSLYATYQPGSTYKFNQSATLYAVWQAVGNVQTYTITYHANGGSGAPSSQTKQQGKSIYISNTKPTKSGYTFLGWSTNSNATTAMYSLGTLYSNDENLNLYAVWQQQTTTQTYTIKYNANNGNGAPSSQTGTYGQVIYISNTIPTRSGYTFLGWSSSSYATSPSYTAGSAITVTGNVTLYAVWQQQASTQTYTITYDFNGGHSGPSNQTKKYNQTTYISSTVPKKSGYVFDGWKQISPYTGQIYLAGTAFTDNQSVTLQAIWKLDQQQTYTITYDFNGGHSGPSNQTKIYNQTTYISSTVPKKLGYVFDGWKQISPYTGQIYLAGTAFKDNQSVTLQAIWKSAGSSGSTGGYH